MELGELKNIWKEEDKNLESKINFIENYFVKMSLDKTSGEVDQMVRRSLLGRNFALVYCLVSLILAILMLEEIVYSIPAIVGGFAMLGSFISHLSIEKPNYTASLVQLQKTICKFRMHTAVHAKYDMAVVALWLLTFLPIFLTYTLNKSLYSDPKALSIFYLIAVVVLILITALGWKTYQEYDQKLKNAEAYLAELIQFEK